MKEYIITVQSVNLDNCMTEKIVIHHIGAAGMTWPLKHLAQFRSDMCIYLHDANAGNFFDTALDVKCVTQFIYSTNATLPFHTTYDPAASSVYKLNPYFFSWYCDAYADYILSEACSIIESVNMNTTSLDTCLKHNDFFTPDLLSIDAEGTAFDILFGAQDTLKHTSAILCEVEFLELREGQKTFFDIGSFLQDDFIFMGFTNVDEFVFSPYRAPLGCRGKAVPLACDALFFRKPDTMKCLYATVKLAFIALYYGYLEYALFLLKDLDISDIYKDSPQKTVYYTFLTKFLEIIERTEKTYKPTFYDINITSNDAKNRYNRTCPPDHCSFKKIKNAMEERILSLRTTHPTELEMLFYQYEMPHVAELIKKKRNEMFYYK